MAEGLPDLLTVEEAAVLLRIARNSAYGLARQWRATNGARGLPVVELGHTLRVPRRALERLLGVEFTAWPGPERKLRPQKVTSRQAADSNSPADGADSNVTPIRRRRRTSGTSAQPPLFHPENPTEEKP